MARQLRPALCFTLLCFSVRQAKLKTAEGTLKDCTPPFAIAIFNFTKEIYLLHLLRNHLKWEI
jgi:hypothetical protein